MVNLLPFSCWCLFCLIWCMNRMHEGTRVCLQFQACFSKQVLETSLCEMFSPVFSKRQNTSESDSCVATAQSIPSVKCVITSCVCVRVCVHVHVGETVSKPPPPWLTACSGRADAQLLRGKLPRREGQCTLWAFSPTAAALCTVVQVHNEAGGILVLLGSSQLLVCRGRAIDMRRASSVHVCQEDAGHVTWPQTYKEETTVMPTLKWKRKT